MGVGPDGVSPTKKRKLMHAPEGFENTTKRTAAKAKATYKFVSAFDDAKRSKLSSIDSPLSVPRPPDPPPPQTSQVGPSKESSVCVSSFNLAGSSNGAAHVSVVRKTVARPMKPPEFPSLPGSNTKFTLKSHVPVLPSRKHVTAQPVIKPILKASIQDYKPLLPAPPPPKPAKALQALPPPPPIPRKPGAPDPRKLKTISTTRIAIATDPRTESGTDELLALYLGQHAPTYVPPAQREFNRGLGQSPEKASKNKSAKYIRGGLAERAQNKFRGQSNLLSLWHKDMELQVLKRHRPIPPDLRLKILEILHVTAITTLQRSQNAPRLSIVRCAKILDGRPLGNLTVLLDFGCPGSAAAKAHTLDEVNEDKNVLIWRPWKSSDPKAEELLRNGVQPRDGTVLFCTRFQIP